MREAKRWLVWRSVAASEPSKKPRKVPFYASGVARNGALDTDQDRAQLVDFATALAALPRYTGLGFALGPDGTGQNWQGVDLDDLPNRPALQLLADDGLPGYTETSPSGRGLHAIGYGRPFAPLGSNSSGIEAYSAGRYFTVTADNAGLGEPTCLADFVSQVLAPRHSQHAPPADAAVAELVPAATLAELRSALAAMRADDRDLWVANGQRLKRLGEPGRALWIEWSQQSDKFDPADAARVWDSFAADRTGYQAIFAEAQRRRWVNPLSGGPVVQPPPADLPASISTALSTLTTDEIRAAAEPYPHAFMGGAHGQAGLFPEREVTVLGAPGREGKTSAVMAVLEAYILGRPLAGLIPAECRPAMIYSAEDDRRQYARKLGAHMRRLSDIDAKRLLASLYVPDLHSDGMAAWREIVRVAHRQPVRGEIVEPLIATITALPSKPGVIVFETASTLSDAEEDNIGHRVLVAALKRIAYATDTAVVLVHHTSQAAASELPELNLSETAIRGGTALVNNCRQCLLLVNLGSEADPFPDGDARTLLRHLIAPGEQARVSMLVTLNTSKGADPPPIFFRWDDTGEYGPRLVEVDPPASLQGKSWRSVKKHLTGARAEARADKKAEAGQANVRLVVKAAADIAEAGDPPTAAKISAKCGRNPGWAKPYLAAAVELGELVRSTEQVPHAKGMTDVYRPVGGDLPWANDRDSMNDSMAPWLKSRSESK